MNTDLIAGKLTAEMEASVLRAENVRLRTALRTLRDSKLEGTGPYEPFRIIENALRGAGP